MYENIIAFKDLNPGDIFYLVERYEDGNTAIFIKTDKELYNAVSLDTGIASNLKDTRLVCKLNAVCIIKEQEQNYPKTED